MSKQTHLKLVPRDYDDNLATWEENLLKEPPFIPKEEEAPPRDEEVKPFLGNAYIAGPVRGKLNGNKEYFAKVARRLRSEGWVVTSPGEYPEDKTDEWYMELSIDGVLNSTTVFFLPGWQDSAGARLEYQVAKATGKYLVYVDNASPTEPVELTAANLVRNGHREAQYGHPANDFLRTAGMRSGLHGQTITSLDVAMDMVLLKLSRLKADPFHRDSLVDAVGYLICYERILEQVVNQPIDYEVTG